MPLSTGATGERPEEDQTQKFYENCGGEFQNFLNIGTGRTKQIQLGPQEANGKPSCLIHLGKKSLHTAIEGTELV